MSRPRARGIARLMARAFTRRVTAITDGRASTVRSQRCGAHMTALAMATAASTEFACALEGGPAMGATYHRSPIAASPMDATATATATAANASATKASVARVAKGCCAQTSATLAAFAPPQAAAFATEAGEASAARSIQAVRASSGCTDTGPHAQAMASATLWARAIATQGGRAQPVTRGRAAIQPLQQDTGREAQRQRQKRASVDLCIPPRSVVQLLLDLRLSACESTSVRVIAVKPSRLGGWSQHDQCR